MQFQITRGRDGEYIAYTPNFFSEGATSVDIAVVRQSLAALIQDVPKVFEAGARRAIEDAVARFQADEKAMEGR